MNWITLLLQVANLRKSLHESQAMIEAAKQMAERGKRTFVFLLALAIASLFFFSGLLIAVIDLGQQIEHGGLHFSGLMVSSCILVAIGLVLVAFGALLSRGSPVAVERLEPRASPREDRIKELLEEFLVNFLANLVAPKQKKDPPRGE